MSATYYFIKDLGVLGKDEEYIPYLYKPGMGWVADKDNILMDRIMGYDDSEPDASPYQMGNSSMMDLVEIISEERANKIIEDL